MSGLHLPAGYEPLERFVDRWAISGSACRAQRRNESSAEERQTFFDAAKDFVGPALDQLDKKALASLDDSERRLLDLMLSFAHVALAVEIQGEAEPRHAHFRTTMRITKSPADGPPP